MFSLKLTIHFELIFIYGVVLVMIYFLLMDVHWPLYPLSRSGMEDLGRLTNLPEAIQIVSGGGGIETPEV